MIQQSVQRTNQSVTVVQKAAEKARKIEPSASQMAGNVGEIAVSFIEQSRKAAHVNNSMAQME